MPFFTNIFEDNVFNIFLMANGSDSELLVCGLWSKTTPSVDKFNALNQ